MDSNNFYEKIYSRFPQIYQEEDSKIGLPLKRYLKSLDEGGYSDILDKTNNLLKLIDAQKRNELNISNIREVIASQYGIKLPNTQINDSFLDHFLNELPQILKTRGSRDALEYTVALLTGFTPVITETPNEHNGVTIHINAVKELDGAQQYLPNEKVFADFLKIFVPFYTDIKVSYSSGQKMSLRSFLDILGKSGGITNYNVLDWAPCIISQPSERGGIGGILQSGGFVENNPSHLIVVNRDFFANNQISKIEITGKYFSENNVTFRQPTKDNCHLLSPSNFMRGDNIRIHDITSNETSVAPPRSNSWYTQEKINPYDPYWGNYSSIVDPRIVRKVQDSTNGYEFVLNVRLPLDSVTSKTPLIMDKSNYDRILARHDGQYDTFSIKGIKHFTRIGRVSSPFSTELPFTYSGTNIPFTSSYKTWATNGDTKKGNHFFVYNAIKGGLLSFKDASETLWTEEMPSNTITIEDITDNPFIWLPYDLEQYKDTIQVQIYYSGDL